MSKETRVKIQTTTTVTHAIITYGNDDTSQGDLIQVQSAPLDQVETVLRRHLDGFRPGEPFRRWLAKALVGSYWTVECTDENHDGEQYDAASVVLV